MAYESHIQGLEEELQKAVNNDWMQRACFLMDQIDYLKRKGANDVRPYKDVNATTRGEQIQVCG